MPNLFTHSFAHLVRKFGHCSWEKEERDTLLGGGYSLMFGLLSWNCIGYLY
jgi:hypothetical protein